MPSLDLDDMQLLFGTRDLTGLTNSVSISADKPLESVTSMGQGTIRRASSDRKLSTKITGRLDPDDGHVKPFIVRTKRADQPVSFLPFDGLCGDVGYTFPAKEAQFSYKDELLGDYELSIEGRPPLVTGKVFVIGRKTSSGQGDYFELDIKSRKNVYASIHVLDSSGGGDQTMLVSVESQAVWSPSKPGAQRVIFPEFTNRKASFFSIIDNKLVDRYWRVIYDIKGSSNPSFLFAVLLGVA